MNGLVLGASNDQAPPGVRTLQLGEALEALMPYYAWTNLAVPGDWSNDIVDQAREAQSEDWELVVVGITQECFVHPCIDAVHNMRRVQHILRHATLQIFINYPEEQAITYIEPFYRPKPDDWTLNNLKGYNREMRKIQEQNPNVRSVAYPDYTTLWATTGKGEGFHADAQTTMAMAVQIANETLH